MTRLLDVTYCVQYLYVTNNIMTLFTNKMTMTMSLFKQITRIFSFVVVTFLSFLQQP